MIAVLIFILVVVIGFLFFNRKKKPSNPYVNSHIKKWKLEEEYENYLDWLDEQGGDVPINKIYFNEDDEALNEIYKYLDKK